MTTTYETITVAGDELTLDLLIWRRFRRPMRGMLTRIYELNPRLSELPTILPVGTKVVIPIDPPPRLAPSRKVIQLWE
jgi:phage tail protein X